MDQVSRAFYELKFKNAVLEKTGNEYQDFLLDHHGEAIPG